MHVTYPTTDVILCESKTDNVAAEVYNKISSSLSERGWAIITDFIPRDLVTQLQTESIALWKNNQFHQAGVGKHRNFSVRAQIRNDSVLWLDPVTASSCFRKYLSMMDELLVAINRSLYLGLFKYEGHVAIYPKGSYYKRHLDQFHNDDLRTLSVILYLNDNWHISDGGQLRIYTPESNGICQELLPHAGQLVVFLSSRFYHEVMTSNRTRLSITGWFSIRPHNCLQ